MFNSRRQYIVSLGMTLVAFGQVEESVAFSSSALRCPERFRAHPKQYEQPSQHRLEALHQPDLDGELEHLDKARKEFETLFLNDDDDDDDTNDDETSGENLPSLLLLTSAGRHRRRLEMDLLESLQDSNDAVDELMHLWMYEPNCAEAAAALQAMEDECSEGLVVEQATLHDLMQAFPAWAEPRVRLATLLFFKGETQASYAMALEAIQMKPWHFEIYSLLVMLSLREQNIGQALYWARRGLPSIRYEPDGETIQKNTRRKAWVAWAVRQAQEQWNDAERATQAMLHKKEQQRQQKAASKRQLVSDEVWQ